MSDPRPTDRGICWDWTELLRPVLHAAPFVMLAALGSVALAAGPAAALRAGTDWPTVGGDDGNTHHTPLTQITPANVHLLRGAWVRELASRSRSAPVVVHGVMYLSDATTIYALDAKSGATRWTYTLTGAAPSWNGLAVADGRVYSGLFDTRVVALDAATGALVWTRYVGNVPEDHVNAGSGGRIQDPAAARIDAAAGMITAAPTYINGMLVVALSGGDVQTRCKVVGLDARDGTIAWQWWVIPTPGEPGSETWPANVDYPQMGGGAIWSRGAADPALGLVYFGTGNASPAFGGEVRPGANLYTASVVALDAASGALRWHQQLVHHDLWESDIVAPLVLFDATRGGRTTPALAVMRPDGQLFQFDRATGRPLVPVEERPVRQDARQRTAPTQPYPVGAEAVAPNCTPRENMPPGFEPGCYFEPTFYDRPNLMLYAGVRQAPMSFEPRSGRFFVAAGISPWWYRRDADPYLLRVAQPPGTRPEGRLTAYDARAQKIVWQQRTPWALGGGGGSMTTATGLLFRPEGDGNFIALRARTGDELWRFQTGVLGGPTPSGLTSSAPSSAYEVDGGEYIALAMGTQLWAFKLGGPLAARPAPPVPPTAVGFQGRVERLAAGDEIAIALLQPSPLPDSPHFVDESSFTPARASVPVGQPVRFTNYGVATHTVTAIDGSWTSGPIAPGASATVTIAAPGRYTYRATEFPWSVGQLIVQPGP